MDHIKDTVTIRRTGIPQFYYKIVKKSETAPNKRRFHGFMGRFAGFNPPSVVMDELPYQG
jgi:hypothetical protein